MTESGNQDISVMKLDLSSLQSVRDFAKHFNANESRLDILIHNAGYASTFDKKSSVDGIELTFATNHYGPFLLTHLLIDLLKKSAPSRIVVVGSAYYRLSGVGLDNFNPTDSIPWFLYYVSKGWNILFTKELAKRLEGTNVTANVLHPGTIDTPIWTNGTSIFFKPGLFLLKKLFFSNTVEGAKTSIYLATSKDVEGVSGKYYSYCQEVEPRQSHTDPENCLKLWEESAKMVKLQPSDPKI